MSDGLRTEQQIRTLHPYGFRPGQWATLLTTVPAPEVRGDINRSCYVVRFDDGVEDFWVVGDPSGEYEFRSERPGEPRPSLFTDPERRS